ncbi:MAG: 4'-phosphopantetheinyl transferase superfamily protein [Tannerella sp.]|jgi:4'-phosphopantetheinyl transferase EntD|nr:4'-phosphopantetheinyl transferase superfamily protein [Tannerella sp.]
MPLLQKYSSPHWGVWKIEECWEQLLTLFESPALYRPFLDKCRSEIRKAEWLAVRLLLRELTSKEASVAYHDNGAPYLLESEYNISISHTKGYAAVILDCVHSVGIDIEYRSERVQRIKSRFLNEDEYDRLNSASTEVLLICWSAKETTFKMTRQRAADFRKDIRILSFELSETTGYIDVKETFTSEAATYRIVYTVTPEYIVTYGISHAGK